MLDLVFIANQLGLKLPSKWHGVDAVMPLLERIKEEGGVVLIKLDGERKKPEDTGPYTVVASGGALGDEFIRIDADTLEEALEFVIVNYNETVWKIAPS